ncbi:MAG: hypothetical protein M3404_05105 [Actinomycetota bacterium]|nr:hypothetical protein [Actinomycetota bacterium]
MSRETLAVVVGYTVLVVWVTSFLAGLFIREYAPSPYVNLALMAVVTASFGVSLLDRKEKDRDGDGVRDDRR